MVFLHRR